MAEEPELAQFGTFPKRVLMYSLECVFILVLKGVRAGIPMLAPIIA